MYKTPPKGANTCKELVFFFNHSRFGIHFLDIRPRGWTWCAVCAAARPARARFASDFSGATRCSARACIWGRWFCPRVSPCVRRASVSFGTSFRNNCTGTRATTGRDRLRRRKRGPSGGESLLVLASLQSSEKQKLLRTLSSCCGVGGWMASMDAFKSSS